jgi:hypothetical protein
MQVHVKTGVCPGFAGRKWTLNHKPIVIECSLKTVANLFNSGRISVGMTKDVPGWAVIELLPMREMRGVIYNSVPVLPIAVTFGTGVAVNLFSNWLCDQLKDTEQPRIKINRQWIEITPDGITNAIKEEIDVQP